MQRLSSIIPSLKGELPSKSGFKQQLIFWAYQKIAGEELASRMQPSKFQNGTLFVRSSSDRWKNNFCRFEQETHLTDKVNELLGKKLVSSIKIDTDGT